MDLQKDIKPITYLKSRSAKLIDSLNRTHRPVVITQNGEARAVIQDIASYEAMRKALLLLKMTAQAENDIKHKRLTKQKDVFSGLNKTLHQDD